MAALSTATKFPFSRDERVELVSMALHMSPEAFVANFKAEHDAEKYDPADALRWIAAQINNAADRL